MAKLDLKYRPLRFSDVLGNEGVRKVLLKRSADGTLGDQSMMFGGPKGCGKTSMARIVARALLCESLDGGEPCGVCPMCRAILDDACDAVEELDAASQGTVDRVRSMVQEADYGTIGGGDRHVYIIDEAQRLSKAAQDALLKAVESRLFIVILCTTEPQNIKGPIRDRVEEYPVYPPALDDIVARLEAVCKAESVKADRDALTVIAEMTGRTPRSCLLAVDSISVLGDVTLDLVRAHFRFNSYSIVERVLRDLDSNPASAFSFLDHLSRQEGPTWIRDSIVLAISSGLRSQIGAKATYPTKTDFFSVRGRGWADLARDLSRIDRPSMADIEAALLSSISASFFPQQSTSSLPPRQLSVDPEPDLDPPLPRIEREPSLPEAKADPPLPPPPPPSQAEPPPPQAEPKSAPSAEQTPHPKEVTVDGVTFSRTESLTTLDEKISFRKNDEDTGERVEIPVGLDESRAPITEKEFVSGFLGKYRAIR